MKACSQAKPRSTTQQCRPRPEPWATPRRATSGRPSSVRRASGLPACMVMGVWLLARQSTERMIESPTALPERGKIESISEPIVRVRIVAPAAPGGGWDQTARAMQLPDTRVNSYFLTVFGRDSLLTCDEAPLAAHQRVHPSVHGARVVGARPFRHVAAAPCGRPGRSPFPVDGCWLGLGAVGRLWRRVGGNTLSTGLVSGCRRQTPVVTAW